MDCCSQKDFDKKESDIKQSSNKDDQNSSLRDILKKFIRQYLFLGIILIIILIFILSLFFGDKFLQKSDNGSLINNDSASGENLPTFSETVSLPVRWGDLGKRMVEAGVIDKDKLEQIYAQRGGLDESSKKLLYGSDNGKLVISPQNSGFLLNILWAFGLINKSPVLEKGPMQEERFGGAGKFASTGGWTLSKGPVMNYYSAMRLVELTPEQESLVESVSKNIYRPCCGNSTYFPDCNHGMAMLGLLELMAFQGANEKEMYDTALVVNSYWFPDTYQTIAKYFAGQGIKWKDVDAKKALGFDFSSSSGYSQVLSQVEPVQGGGGNGCAI
ncbi:MAG: hypothetical protein PHW72_02190 [Candidatus Pacebacteria bacterium]|nr:hypothetical protein [Candidatus Paceibacterota bacterium]